MTDKTPREFSLRHIRYFVTAAEAGQISQAGVQLGVSQSAVTEAVRGLEATTRVKLINRHSRGISLTQEGYKFLSHARKILAAVADAQLAISNANPAFTGKLRLGVTITVAGYYLAMPLMRFRRAFPNIVVEPVELERAEIERQLVSGDLDMGLMLLAQFEDTDHIDSATLLRSRRRLWLSPNHPLLAKDKVSLRDVAAEPYLMLTTDENLKTTAQYWKKSKLYPNVAFSTNSVEAIRSLIANDCGVTILSDMVFRPWSLEGERIMARTLCDALPPLDVGLAWVKGADSSELIRVFRDFCTEGANMSYAPVPNSANFLRETQSL